MSVRLSISCSHDKAPKPRNIYLNNMLCRYPIRCLLHALPSYYYSFLLSNLFLKFTFYFQAKQMTPHTSLTPPVNMNMCEQTVQKPAGEF